VKQVAVDENGLEGRVNEFDATFRVHTLSSCVCVPLKILENAAASSPLRKRPARMTSSKPSLVSASGAIHIVPPVYWLFENDVSTVSASSNSFPYFNVFRS
jgi:hypothetical protein